MPRSSEEGSAKTVLDDLVYRIHADHAAVDPWRGALELLSGGLRAQVAFFGRHRFTRGEHELLSGHPVDSGFWHDYASFASRNPWFMSSEDYVAGRVMLGDDLIDPTSLQRTDFYRKVLKTHGLLHALCGVVGLQDDAVHYLMVLRCEHDSGFGDADRTAMERAVGHFRLALDCEWRLRECEDLARTLMRVVDHHAQPTLLVTADGRLVYRNRKAATLELSSPALTVEAGRIRGTTTSNDKALRDAMQGVLRDAPATTDESCRIVRFSEPDGRLAAILTVRSVGRLFRAAEASVEDIVLLTLRDAQSDHDPRACAFARQYALTPAQARVSSLVFCGRSLQDAAIALGVSENTIRSHLKQVFEKTDTHGQLELVHLHARVCGNDA